MHEKRRARLVAYGVAVLATGISILLRWPLWPVIGDHAPFMTFFPAVILSAYLGGLGPGLVATCGSGAAAAFFLVQPHFSFAVYDPADILALGLYILTGGVLSVLSEFLHRSRRRILASERRYAVTLASIGDAVIATNAQARVTFLNSVAEALTGWPLGDAVGRPLAEVFRIVNEQTRQPAEDPAAKVLRSGTVVGLANHTALLARDGRETPIDDCGAPIIDDCGGIAGVVLVFRDVSQRRKAEEAEAVRQASARLDLAVRGSNLAIWEFNMPDGRIENSHATFINVWESLGYDPDDPSFLTDFTSRMTLVHPDDRERVEHTLRAYLSGEARDFESEYRVRHKDGSDRWHSRVGWRCATRRKHIRFIGSSVDITDLKRAEAARRKSEEELRHVNARLELAVRGSDIGIWDIGMPDGDFRHGRVYTVNIWEQLGYERPASPSDHEAAIAAVHPDDRALMEEAARRYLAGETDKFEFESRNRHKDGSYRWRLARGAAVRDAQGKPIRFVGSKRAEEEIGRLNQELRSRIDEMQAILDIVPIGIGVAHDPECRLITHNPYLSEITGVPLGKNAVEREAAVEPAGRQEALLRFSVGDTGIGIPVDKQATIFRPFEQEDTSTMRKYGGTGLGLTIAARLVALMGGQITLDSAPGRGSTFAFTAQFGIQPHPAEPTAAQPPVLLRNLPVLIIDDNATNRQILLEWLRGWRMEPAAAGDGVAAMDALWDAAARGRPYALVLLDAHMPDTDGLALAAQIRKRAALSATRIILLSSGDRPGDWDRYRVLRIDAHLLKPVQQDEILDRIYQVMSRTRGDEPTEARPAAGRELPTSPAPGTTPLHILLAEDDEFSARFMEELLARSGHRVRPTANGREALSLAEAGGFDLLLLDIHMPERDGFQVAQAIREREHTAAGHLPIIALTARSRREDRDRCLAAGMDDFLTKPVAATALLAAIARLVSSHPVSPSPQTETGASRSLLDPIAVLRACGDDAEGLRGLCQDFRTYAPNRLGEVGEALREQNTPRLHQAAHKFSPLLFVFSTLAGNVASDLEDHAAQGQLEEARPLVERLQAMTCELLRLMDELSLETLRHQARVAVDASRADSERQ